MLIFEARKRHIYTLKSICCVAETHMLLASCIIFGNFLPSRGCLAQSYFGEMLEIWLDLLRMKERCLLTVHRNNLPDPVLQPCNCRWASDPIPLYQRVNIAQVTAHHWPYYWICPNHAPVMSKTRFVSYMNGWGSSYYMGFSHFCARVPILFSSFIKNQASNRC